MAPKAEITAPSGWQTKVFEPRKYAREETTFTEGNTLYYFKEGAYDVTSISLPSDSILYFERGTSLRIYEQGANDYFAAVSASGVQNVKILGRALLDFSACMGGDGKTKGAYSFSQVNGLEIEGLVSVNSNNWTMCFHNSKNVEVSRCMFFSYRTYSDGVMFSDCKDSRARDCFVRTGDDAMEIKAFTDSTDPDCYTDGVLFENNCVWTDKGIGYGCIYESKHDIKNVIFRNNSIGFAQASWSEHLSCCTVQMGSVKTSTWEDIHFENMEVYKTSCALLSVFNRANNEREGGKIKDIYFENITAKYAVPDQSSRLLPQCGDPPERGRHLAKQHDRGALSRQYPLCGRGDHGGQLRGVHEYRARRRRALRPFQHQSEQVVRGGVVAF